MQLFKPNHLKRLIIRGSGNIGLAATNFALEHNISVEVLISERQADSRNNDGEKVVEKYRELGIDVQIKNNLRDGPEGPYETANEETLIFSFGSPYIIKQDLISLYKGRIINSHSAPLPEGRGGGGFSWRILSGDRRGSVCFHQLTAGIDRGDILFQSTYLFPKEARFPIDWQRIDDREASTAIVKFLNQLLSGISLHPAKQNEAIATYFPRLHTPTQAFIDWSWQPEEIERFVLAFSRPYEGAKTLLGQETVHIMDCNPSEKLRTNHTFLNGLIIRVHRKIAHVILKDRLLEIPLEAIRCDIPIREGDRFHTPSIYLDTAKQMRPVFTPTGLKNA